MFKIDRQLTLTMVLLLLVTSAITGFFVVKMGYCSCHEEKTGPAQHCPVVEHCPGMHGPGLHVSGPVLIDFRVYSLN